MKEAFLPKGWYGQVGDIGAYLRLRIKPHMNKICCVLLCRVYRYK